MLKQTFKKRLAAESTRSNHYLSQLLYVDASIAISFAAQSNKTTRFTHAIKNRMFTALLHKAAGTFTYKRQVAKNIIMLNLHRPSIPCIHFLIQTGM